MTPVSFIQLLERAGTSAAVGRHVAEAARHLGLETGRVLCGRVFAIAQALTPVELEQFARVGLQDPIQHEVFVGRLHHPEGFGSYLLLSRRPGVTDDEGVSAQRTLSDLLGLAPEPVHEQRVFSMDLFFLERSLASEDLGRLGESLINPLVGRVECGARFTRVDFVPQVSLPGSAEVEAIDLEVPDAALQALSRDRVLSLTLEELHAIRAWYRSASARDRRELGLPAGPTDCELEILAQTWSEHCKHKEFNASIRYRDLETGEERVIDSLFRTYIRASTERIQQALEAGGARWLLKVFTDNAGVVRVDADRLFVFKVETHNSPSALDPYGGALTGILGVNRDPLGTGRGGARPLFNTNVLCFASPDYAAPLLPGQLHPACVLAGVRKGIEDGGNKSGIPTVAGAVVFDERFAGKPLVFCGTGAILPALLAGRDTWTKEILPGDAIVMAGGRVGKDGIHGATFSSAEIHPSSPRSAVQIGSPITQKQLSDFLERACRAGHVRCLTDCGAGGLSSSVGELALLSNGAQVELDKVPLKYPGLRPWEIFVSESQERMTLAVPEDALGELMRLAAEEEVEVARIGTFTDTGRLEVRHAGQVVASLELSFLHDGVPRKALEAEWRRPGLSEPRVDLSDCQGLLLRLLASPDICSRERFIRQYDHEVKSRTVVKPLMGPRGLAPQDAAVLRLDFDSWLGVAVSHGIAPRYADLDAYESAAGAFDEAVRQLIAVGARLPDPSRAETFWSANDNFCVPDSVYDPVGNPDGRYKLAQLVRMCEALYDSSTFFGVPMTSGKDSMKNDLRAGGRKISVPPTVLFSMVARIDDVRRTVTTEFKAPGDVIFLVGETRDELGGSELYRLFGRLGANVPRVRRDDARARYLRMEQAHAARLLESCHDLSDGGLGVALAECCFGGLGFEVILPSGVPVETQLFSETHSRFVASVRRENASAFERLMGGDARRLGVVTASGLRVFEASGHVRIALGLDEVLAAWRGGLEEHG